MISSKDIEDYSYLVSARFEAINTHYLKLIANQINEIGRLGPANLHRLQQMAKFNQNIEEINKLLMQETGRTLDELYQVYDMSGFSLYEDYADMYKANGVTQIPFADNVAIQGYLNSVKSLTQGTFMNMANTTIASHSNYQKLVDTAIDAIATGQTDYKSMIRNQMMAIADEGLTVTYASGYRRRLDSAVRMNILEGVRKVNEGVRQVSGEQFGADGYEVSVHALCAKDHIDIQGNQYAIGSVEKTVEGKKYQAFDVVNGGLKRHLGTCNCKHTIFPIILGISEPSYTKDELKQYKANSEQPVTLTTGYDKYGNPRTKTVTKYEATQYQRNIETEIRRAKDRHIIAENAGDTVGTKQSKDKILALRKTYKRISQEAGLTPKWDRTFVAGYTGKQTTPKPIKLSYPTKKSVTHSIEDYTGTLSILGKEFNIQDLYNLGLGTQADIDELYGILSNQYSEDIIESLMDDNAEYFIKDKLFEFLLKESNATLTLVDPKTIKIDLPDRIKRTFPNSENAIIKILEKTSQNFRDKFLDITSRIPINTSSGGAFFSPRNKSVTLNPSKVAQGNSIETPFQVLFHEFGHAIDNDMSVATGMNGKGWTNHISDDYEFFALLKDEADLTLGHKVLDDKAYLEVLIKDSNTDLNMLRKHLAQHTDPDIVQKYNDVISWSQINFISLKDTKFKRKLVNILGKDEVYQMDWFKEWSIMDKPYRKIRDKESRQNESTNILELKRKHSLLERGDLSDMLEPHIINASSEYPLNAGHGNSYWNKSNTDIFRSKVCTEAFAEMYSATVCNEDSLKVIKQYFPKSYQKFLDIIGGL